MINFPQKLLFQVSKNYQTDLHRPRLCIGYVPAAVDKGLLGCDALLLGEQSLAFEMRAVPSPSRSSTLLGYLDP
jgi:hypothetical protein